MPSPSRRTLNETGSRGGRLAQLVGGSARVGAAVVLLGVLQVQRHETKVVHGRDAVR